MVPPQALAIQGSRCFMSCRHNSQCNLQRLSVCKQECVRCTGGRCCRVVRPKGPNCVMSCKHNSKDLHCVSKAV
jgi:hypothetical protein